MVSEVRKPSVCGSIEKNELESLKKTLKLTDVNKADREGVTALHKACELGRKEMVLYLLEIGADTAAVDHFGHTPLRVAVKHRHFEIIQILRREEAPVSIAPFKLGMELVSAVKKRDQDLLRAWSLAGVDMDQGNFEKCTAMKKAQQMQDPDLIRCLLDCGATPLSPVPVLEPLTTPAPAMPPPWETPPAIPPPPVPPPPTVPPTETAPVTLPTPVPAPVIVPPTETAPVTLPTPVPAPVIVPPTETAPVTLPTPVPAPVIVPPTETAPVTLPTPVPAPPTVPPTETAPVTLPTPVPAPVIVPPTETAPVTLPTPVPAPVIVVPRERHEEEPVPRERHEEEPVPRERHEEEPVPRERHEEEPVPRERHEEEPVPRERHEEEPVPRERHEEEPVPRERHEEEAVLAVVLTEVQLSVAEEEQDAAPEETPTANLPSQQETQTAASEQPVEDEDPGQDGSEHHPADAAEVPSQARLSRWKRLSNFFLRLCCCRADVRE
ncbi:uncharacterized protein LOC136711737 [Amia ocellicauda]|uniref:uncharacterized protein LOC136711737 n=1 Tax=Amia ocellicauda TaxID=2972642 RepID=UPI0034649B0B